MTPILAEYRGYWWPATDTDAHGVITADCEPSIKALLTHVHGRDLILQAGGNVGVYPVALADHFQKVVTFEPDPVNWECLTRNLAARDSLKRVDPIRGALGQVAGRCAMVPVKASNCGAHRIGPGDAIDVWTVDELMLPALDCIWVDCEGSELFALMGAAQTIERFSPVICAEDKGLHRAFGVADGALQAWLAERGYEQADKIGQDKVFLRRAT